MKTLISNAASKKSPSRSNAPPLVEEVVPGLERHGGGRGTVRLVNILRENPVSSER